MITLRMRKLTNFLRSFSVINVNRVYFILATFLVTWVTLLPSIYAQAEIGVSVSSISQTNYTPFIMLAMLLTVILIFYFVYQRFKLLKGIETINKSGKLNNSLKLVEKHEIDDSDIERYLKSDEKELIRILKLKDGSCNQGTLVTVSNFSKSMVSELLKELEERNIIYRKKKGRSNIVFLK